MHLLLCSFIYLHRVLIIYAILLFMHYLFIYIFISNNAIYFCAILFIYLYIQKVHVFIYLCNIIYSFI